jgi:hypothetical protein
LPTQIRNRQTVFICSPTLKKSWPAIPFLSPAILINHQLKERTGNPFFPDRLFQKKATKPFKTYCLQTKNSGHFAQSKAFFAGTFPEFFTVFLHFFPFLPK